MKKLISGVFLVTYILLCGISTEGKIFVKSDELTDIILFSDFDYDNLRDYFLKQMGVDIKYVSIFSEDKLEVTQENFKEVLNDFENTLIYEYRDIFGKKISSSRKIYIISREEFQKSISISRKYTIKNVSVDTVYNDVTLGKIIVGKVFTEPKLQDNKDCYIIKFDRNNIISWGKMFEDSKINKFNKIINVSPDEYCLIASAYRNSEWTDGFVMKFNGRGDVIWREFYGSSHIDDFKDVISVNDGELIVLAEVSNNDGDVEATITINNPLNKDLVVLKYGKDGKIIWQNSVTNKNELTALKVIDDESSFLVFGEVFEDNEVKSIVVSGFDMNGKRKFSTIIEDFSVDILNEFIFQ